MKLFRKLRVKLAKWLAPKDYRVTNEPLPKPTPVIPPAQAVIDDLRKVFPEPKVSPGYDKERAMWDSGANSVIRYLDSLRRKSTGVTDITL